jgi:hypothetical protein
MADRWVLRRAQDRLYAEAACRNKPPYLFEETQYWNLVSDLALNICCICTVKEDCLMVVNPTESYYDGVAGGMIFKNGEIVSREKPVVKPKVRKLRKSSK